MFLCTIREVFHDRVNGYNIWPAQSPDLTLFDFYQWGALKGKVYTTNPHMLQEHKDNICKSINSILQRELQNV